MKILIIGASQGTGALAVKEALSRGHEVTAFARSPQKLGLDHPKLRKQVGDFHQKASVADAVKGHDAVVVTASATSMKAFKTNPQYFSAGTAHVIEAMRTHGVRRLVVLSALGAGDSRSLLPFFLRPIILTLLKIPFTDHGVQEEQTKASGLDWVIARPGRLTDGAARKQYVKKAALEKVPSAISRADVADFLIEAATTDAWIKKAVQIGG